MKRQNTVRWVASILLLLLMAGATLGAEPDEKDLRGLWKFRIGDRSEWALPQHDDTDWDMIRVPARWENEGFRGYDGYAWYRTRFTLGADLENKKLTLELGYIDDVDEAFINGIKIGQTGSFSPRYETAYNALRKYEIPPSLIRFGEENVLAVRVYDSQLEGGIVSGNIRIYSTGVLPPFHQNLTGTWLFNKGKAFHEQDHSTIQVPGAWENQGYNNYDGYAVYTRIIQVSEAIASQRLVLLAGKIDDADRVYINGEFIGETGDFNRRGYGELHREFRNYFIPPHVLKAGKDNILEIRVYDTGGFGGIYEGPVGLMTQDKFRQYWKSKRRN